MFLSRIDSYYSEIKQNKWFWILQLLCRILLAYAFIVAGMVKILDERFASGLSELHPMGAYLTALHHTGYYYAFIGYAQVLAAVLLLFPKTVTLGALLYLPIITNIWILSYAVRFEGSFVTSPLMVLANMYILVWNYDKLKYILPFHSASKQVSLTKPDKYSYRFPYLFFSVVVILFALVIWFAEAGLDVMPRNSLTDCQKQFIGSENEAAGFAFCECIHSDGNALNQCLFEYEKLNN